MTFKPMEELFKRAETAIPKDVLFKQYIEYTQKQFPKIIFYIIMDEVYPQLIAKAPNGDLGYRLNLNI